MARLSAVFRMADRLANGDLRGELARHVSEDCPYDLIAKRLFADFGIEVTRQTVSNWCRDLGLTQVAS